MSYADLTEAKEAIGGHVRSVLEITLTDKAGNRPTGDWWTETKTLHLCGGEPFLRTDTPSTEGFRYYENLVKDWGVVVQECQIGQAFGNIADTQIILHNRKIAAQQNNSTYTFAAGSAAMDPEPDMVQLAELFHFYNFLSATVVIKVLFFSGTFTDQGTAANFESRTIFNGFIQGVDIDGDDVTLDITQDQTVQETILPGRLLEDSIDSQVKTIRAPIVYGNFYQHFTSTGSADEVNGLDMYNAIRGGLFRPTMVNALPWKRDANHETGADNRLMYIYNDVKGRNNGWIGQDGFSGRDSLNEGPWLYHPQADVWTLLDSSSGSPSSGFIDWPSWAGDMEEALINQEDYLKGDVSIPCVEVYASNIDAGSTLSGEKNLFDGDPHTHCLFPVDHTDNTLDLRIKNVPPLGSIVNEANAVRAFIVVDTSSVTTSTAVRFGLYLKEATDTAPMYWGETVGNPPGGEAVYGVLSESGGTIAKQFRDQSTNAVDIGVGFYYPTDGFTHKVSQWEWKGTNWYDPGTGNQHNWGDLVVRVECSTAGSAGEQLKIIAAGVTATHFPAQTITRKVIPWIVRSSYQLHPEWYGGKDPTAQPGPNNVVTSDLWVNRAKNTLDDGSNTLTETTYGNITYPCDIAAHLMLKWGQGVASADVELDESAVSNGSPFGSGFRADEQVFLWNLYAAAQHTQLVINQETTLGQELDNFMAQFPLMLYREVGDDVVYFGFYPENDTDVNRYYTGSTPIKFHPNIDHPDADDYGKPYVVQDVKMRLTPLGEIFNRFTIRYRGYGPQGMTQKYTITETPNDSNTLNTSTNLNDGHVRDEPGGYNPSAVCRVSQERYGVSRWLNIDAPSQHTHNMAYGLTNYLLRRYSQPRILVEATCGPEAIDLKPGHLISFSDDMNLVGAVPDYGSAAAKITGWAYTGEIGDPHKDFIVQRIARRPQDYGCETTFTSEQIMYNPRGEFWDPTDISTGTVVEHLHADDITTLTDGDGVGDAADWTARVGTDGSQSTSTRRPTYESASGDLQNGYPIVRWNDSTDGLVITGFTTQTGNFVMGFVFNQNSTTGTQTIFRSETNGPEVQIADAGNVVISDGGGAATIGAAATGKQSLVVKADATDGIEVWRNGTSIGTDGTYTSVTPGGAQIIGNQHGFAEGIDADLYEVVIINYPSDVDDDEVERLIGYLNHEWGLEGELPANHAYRYSPPTNG